MNFKIFYLFFLLLGLTSYATGLNMFSESVQSISKARPVIEAKKQASQAKNKVQPISTKDRSVIKAKQQAFQPKNKVQPISTKDRPIVKLKKQAFQAKNKTQSIATKDKPIVKAKKQTSQPKNKAQPISEAKPIIEANNQFSLNFYAHLDKKEGKNIFFSPYSVSTAVAMLYEGARNETAKEIQSVFHFPANESLRRSSFSAAHSYLNRDVASYKLNAANAFWIERGFQLQAAFKTVLMKFYKGAVFNANFKKSPEQERQKINQWVENKTEGRIKDILPQGSISPLTRLAIANAVYFKGMWEKAFKKEQTSDGAFWLSEKEWKRASMMYQSDYFNYAQTETLQILEMPYKGGDLSMLILLPRGKTAEDLRSLEESLTLENLNRWRGSLKEQELDMVLIPKFTFTQRYSLKKSLGEMGMPLAFTSKADFSGIIKNTSFVVDAIFHKAFVKVNEEGTEAAAATSLMASITSGGRNSLVFKADHPFVFLIQERTTGYILFMGRMANP